MLTPLILLLHTNCKEQMVGVALHTDYSVVTCNA